VTRETQQLPIDVAHAAPLEQHCDAMFCGVHINTSENSAVRHTALGESRSVPIVHGQNGVEYGHAVRDAMDSFTDRLRSGESTGTTGGRVKIVITNRPRWGVELLRRQIRRKPMLSNSDDIVRLPRSS
jgi:glucose-6-phosphate isomerase